MEVCVFSVHSTLPAHNCPGFRQAQSQIDSDADLNCATYVDPNMSSRHQQSRALVPQQPFLDNIAVLLLQGGQSRFGTMRKSP